MSIKPKEITLIKAVDEKYIVVESVCPHEAIIARNFLLKYSLKKSTVGPMRRSRSVSEVLVPTWGTFEISGCYCRQEVIAGLGKAIIEYRDEKKEKQ